ncbi:hypothetical protein P692DRAFT_20831728 [Suillus brevipes Sb2]|nr:hypothetical protein P692DRAFT_20831728 [Suillus brevipes Sb2]
MYSPLSPPTASSHGSLPLRPFVLAIAIASSLQHLHLVIDRSLQAIEGWRCFQRRQLRSVNGYLVDDSLLCARRG